MLKNTANITKDRKIWTAWQTLINFVYIDFGCILFVSSLHNDNAFTTFSKERIGKDGNLFFIIDNWTAGNMGSPTPQSCTCCMWSPCRSVTCRHMHSSITIGMIPIRRLSVGMSVTVWHCIIEGIPNMRGFLFLTAHLWELKSLLMHYLPDVRKTLHRCIYTLFLPHHLFASEATSGSRVADCVVVIFLKARIVRARDCMSYQAQVKCVSIVP